MKIGILQPGYLPWLGFFEQIYRVNKFVIYDDVQYTKHDWRSRNRIKTMDGVPWLTVPTHGSISNLINEVKIAHDNRWQKKHMKTIEFAFKRAKYFDWLMPDLELIINKKFEFLVDLDMELIFLLLKRLGIETEITMSSSYNIEETDKNSRMLKILKILGGTYLLEGKSGKNYLNIDIFNSNGIDVEFQDYKHPVYPQLWGEFVPYLSVIDLLFNCGQESLDYIIGKKGLEK